MDQDAQKPDDVELEAEPQWADPDTRWKLANEAWLQAHWKIALPVILAVAFAVFILPWVFFSFPTALGIQLFGAAAFWVVAKRYTTAFSKNR
jgi:hypothetical protein